MILTRRKGLPHEQAGFSVPWHHLEDLVGAIVSELQFWTSATLVYRYDPRVRFDDLVRDPANLPLAIVRPTTHRQRTLWSIDKAFRWKIVEGSMRFSPKHAGSATETEAGYLVDADAAYESFLTKVRPGDFVAKVQDNGDTVDVLEKTTVVDVEPTRLELEVDLFEAGDEYEIHWPLDAQAEFNTTRHVDLEIDVYADPGAFHDAGPSADQVEREINGWWEADVSRFVLLDHGAVRRESYTARDLSDQMKRLSEGNYLNRILAELPLIVAEKVVQPWPTVESLGVVDRFLDASGDTYIETERQLTEDDQRVNPQ